MVNAGGVKVALLPARSVTTAWPVKPRAFCVTTRGLGVLVDATPESASANSNGTLTGPERHSASSGSGRAVPNVRVGGRVSRLMVTVREEVPPYDVTLQVNEVPAVSVVTVWVEHPPMEVTEPFGRSSTLKVTCTLLRYQPSLPSVPVIETSMTGAVRSMFTRGEVYVAELPATSVTVTCCVRPGPSPVNSSGLGTLVEDTPEVVSSAKNGKLTSPVFQNPTGSGLRLPK